MSHYQPQNYKYNIGENKWTKIAKWEHGHYRLSFNLLPIIENRFILVISENKPCLMDTKTDQWIPLHQISLTNELEGVQIGAFTLPIIDHIQESSDSTKTAFDDTDKENKEDDTNWFDDEDDEDEFSALGVDKQ